MRTRALVAGSVAAVLFGPARSAIAGTISEAGDAADMPAAAQTTQGSGLLDTITGTLANFADADMFAVFITNPASFSATTEGAGTVAFDTQLFLFDVNGRGVAANDDISNGGVYNPRSTLTGGPISTVAAGIYYLAVSGWDRDPHSDLGAIYTDDTNYALVVPANGPGGARPITGWDGDGALNGGTGNYTITLSGASFVPEPSSVGLLLAGPFLWRKRG